MIGIFEETKEWQQQARDEAEEYLNNRTKKILPDFYTKLMDGMSKERKKFVMSQDQNPRYRPKWQPRASHSNNATYWLKRLIKTEWITAYDAIKLHHMIKVYWRLTNNASLKSYNRIVEHIIKSKKIKPDDTVQFYKGNVFIGQHTRYLQLINNEVYFENNF